MSEDNKIGYGRVGRGKKVHLLVKYPEGWRPLCSRHGGVMHYGRPDSYLSENDVTCKRCLRKIEIKK
jgi:hypothetical protein